MRSILPFLWPHVHRWTCIQSLVLSNIAVSVHPTMDIFWSHSMTRLLLTVSLCDGHCIKKTFYAQGEYVLRVESPAGWTFGELSMFSLNSRFQSTHSCVIFPLSTHTSSLSLPHSWLYLHLSLTAVIIVLPLPLSTPSPPSQSLVRYPW